MENLENEHLAIVGVSCVLPGVFGLKDYWNQLFFGRSPIKEVPKERFDDSIYFSAQKNVKGKCFTKIASLIDSRKFCSDVLPKFIDQLCDENIPKSNITDDLGHQISLFTAYQALSEAGYSINLMKGKEIGAFIGLVAATDQGMYRILNSRIPCYFEKLREAPDFNILPDPVFGRVCEDMASTLYQKHSPVFKSKKHDTISPHDVAMDMIRCFQLSGIGLTLDSACSSSLMTIALAGEYLRTGKLEAAVVGGVSCFSFGGLIHYSNAQAASADGTRPFDQGANGFIPGEGCAYAVVKTLSKAIADGDRILAVIRGLGISSDGKGKGLWAPRKEGQTLAMQRAYRGQKLSIQDLDYIEAHATSTTLGDATELNALMDAYSDNIPDNVYLTSHKANIGHVFEAAGMAGIIKVVLAMQHETIPPQIHFNSPTSEFEWSKSPFYIPTEPVKWQPRPNEPRRAGVNAFGIGGLNGHIVLEEPSPEIFHKNKKESESAPIKPVAIIGMGTVLPGAFCCDDFRKLLKSGEDARTSIPENRNDLLMTIEELAAKRGLKGGFVNGYQYNWQRHRIPPNQIAKANPLQFMMLGAVDEAIENAGLTAKLDQKRTAVVAGTRSDSDFLTVLNMILFMPELRDVFEKSLKKQSLNEAVITKLGHVFAEHLYKEYPSLDDQTGGFTISTLASRVTKAYDLMGGAVAIDSGLSGGMVALENAMLRLQNGEIDTVICVSGHRAMGQGRFEELQANGILSQSMKNPLAEGADGIVPAEGACAVVLRRLEDAQRDGQPVRGILHAVAGVTSMDNPEEAANRAMTHAHVQSNIAGNRVSFCGLACSGDVGRDQMVLNVLAEKLRAEKRSQSAVVSSEIGQIGHTGPAAGLVSVIRAVLEMEELETFGNVGLDRPNCVIRDNTAVLRCEPSVSPHPCQNDDGRVFATVTNIDPCGMVYHAVLERGVKVEMPSRKIASSTVPRLAKTLLARQKTAFLFPGQGAQKSGMLRKLAAECEPLAKRIKEMDAVLADLKLPTFTDMAWENGKQLGHDVMRTQLSLLVADILFMSLLEDRGLVPDMIFGHSYGEYPALVAAGAWSFETAAQATAKRCEAIVQFAGTGTGMLSTNADEKVLHRMFAEINGQLYISNRNSWEQTIVSGDNGDLKKLESYLKKEKIPAIILPVPAAFHSPLVSGVCEPLKAALSQCYIQPPHHLLLSSIGTQFVSDPKQIRANLVRQMVEPVDFIGMMERAYENGCSVFVEVGPRKILTNLGRNILADKNDVTFLTCDDGKEGSLVLFDEVCRFLKEHQANQPHQNTIQWRESETVIDHSHVDSAKTSRIAANQKSADSPNLPEGFLFFELSGTPYEMGVEYGRKDSGRIRAMMRRYADVTMQPGNMLPDTKDDMENRLDILFTKDDLDELRGMAAGAGVPFDALLRHNLSVFPEGNIVARQNLVNQLVKPAAGCVHFAGKTQDDVFVHGGNLDLPLVRVLHGAVSPTLITRRYTGKIPFVSMGIAGRIGSIDGFNQYGICISSCILLDVLRTNENTCGPLHTAIVTKVLSEADTLEKAVEIVQQHVGTGGWAMLVSDLSSGCMVHVEYNGNKVFINEKPTVFMQASHSVSKNVCNLGTIPSHSVNRLKQLESFLNSDTNGKLSSESHAAFRVLRNAFDIEHTVNPEHRTMNTILRIDNAFSWLINAQTAMLQIAFSRKPDAEDYESNWKSIPLETVLPGMKLAETTEKTIENVEPDIVTTDRQFCVMDYDTFLKRNTAVNEHCPVKLRDTVAERFVNRMVETSLPENLKTVTFPGSVLIYGALDNPVADLLEKKIRDFGGKTHRITQWLEDGQSSETLDHLWNESPFYTLFLVNSYDPNATSYDNPTDWENRFEQGMIGPTLAAQYIYSKLSEKNQLDKLELLAATRLGGDYGLSSHVEAVEGGGNGGIMKAVYIEAIAIHSLYIFAKTVDHWSGAGREAIVQNLFNEYALRDFSLEVGYYENRRFLCKMLPTYLEIPSGKQVGEIEFSSDLDLPQWVETVSQGETDNASQPAWIITGGARGICAEIAYAIGKSRNAKLYLIGSSPIPHVEESWKNLDEEGLKKLKVTIIREAASSKTGKPIDAWEKVNKAIEIDAFFARLKAAEIPFEYFSCDVTNQNTVAKTIVRILAEEKSIEGLVHGAGFEKATRVEKKKSDLIRKTIAVKVTGAFNILQALKGHEPKYLVGMGSVSGRLGASGQLDYITANELLGKLFSSYVKKHPDTKATTISWTAWGDVGMAVRPESRMVLEATGIKSFPVKEGISHLLSELLNGCNEREISVINWEMYKQFCPDETCRFSSPQQLCQQTDSSDVNASWTITAEDFRTLNFSQKEQHPFVTENVTPRYTVRMLEKRLSPPASDVVPGTGAVLIIGTNEISSQIETKLRANGFPIHTLPNGLLADEVEDCLAKLSCEKPIDHVFCVDSYDREFGDSLEIPCESKIDKHVFAVIMACRQVMAMAQKRNALDRLTFTAATRFGGTFGLTGDVSVAFGGVVAGLFKGITDELRVRDSLFVPVRIVDHDDHASHAEVVSHLYDEFCDLIAAVPLKNETPVETLLATPVSNGDWNPHDMEVGYKNNIRYVARTVPLPLEPFPTGHPFETTVKRVNQSSCHNKKEIVSPGGTWVVVGGLRGITSACADALSGIYKPKKIIAVGSSAYEELGPEYLDDKSPLVLKKKKQVISECVKTRQNFTKVWSRFTRNQEMTQNMNKLRQCGAEVEYHICDMRSWDDVSRFVDNLDQKGETITGVINGALYDGVDCALLETPLLEIQNGLNTKLIGNIVLLEKLAKQPLDFYVVFGSVSGRFGGNGQTLYTAANDCLVKLLGQYQRKYPKCRFWCTEWGAWSQTGISWRPNMRGLHIMAGTVFISPEEGTQHFLREFEHGLPELESLFVAWKYYKRFQPNAIHDLPDDRTITSSASKIVLSLPTIMGDNADAKTIGRLNLNDCLVQTLGRDLEGLAVVPEATRKQWYETKILPFLTTLECCIKDDTANLPSRVVVLTATTEIPDGCKIIEKMKQLETTAKELGRSMQFDFLDMPLDISPNCVAQRILELTRAMEKVEQTLPPVSKAGNQPSLLLAEKQLERSSDRIAFQVTVDPKKDTFLLDHQVRNRPILPAVVAMEMMAEAAMLTGNTLPLKAIRNLKINRGMSCTVDDPYRLTVTAKKKETQNEPPAWQVKITGDYYNPKGVLINESCPYFCCELVFANREMKTEKLPPQGKLRWVVEYPEFGTFPIYHGATLRGLKHVDFDNHDFLIGKINCISQKSLFQSRWDKTHDVNQSVVLNPSLIDACLYASGVLHGIGNVGTSILPDYFEEFEIGKGAISPDEECTVFVESQGDIKLPMGYRNMIFNFVLCNNAGEIIYRVKGFRATEVLVKK